VRSILPPEKQFLITRNVPCCERVQTMRNKIGEITELLEDINIMESSTSDGAMAQSNEDGWLLSHFNKPKDDNEEEDFEVVNDHEDDEGENLIKKLTPSLSKTAPSATPLQEPLNYEDDDEYADLEDDTIDHDGTTATAADSTTDLSATTKSYIQRVRTYDISITYDKYYQTPKVWILGYSSEGTPLSTEQMFQDIMPEYVQRTVTIESHPSVGTTQLSIHPCQHAAVMKTILRNLNQAPKVEFYLFIFLKFISSIIPTINYDFTLDVTTNNTLSPSSSIDITQT
jgi:ubiquitin-like-conjugating enzyme ATG3